MRNSPDDGPGISSMERNVLDIMEIIDESNVEHTIPTTNATNSESFNDKSSLPNKDQSLAVNLPSITTQLISSDPKLNNQFYISRFSNDTTNDKIYDYLKLNKLDDRDHIRISSLIPKHRDPATLSYVSFKIDVSNHIVPIITGPNFWPMGCSIKKFVNKKQTIVTIPPSVSNDRVQLNVNTNADNFLMFTSLTQMNT